MGALEGAKDGSIRGGQKMRVLEGAKDGSIRGGQKSMGALEGGKRWEY